MLKNNAYRNASQLEAIAKSNEFANEEMNYAAYKSWRGLEDYAAANPAHEDAVRNWMNRTRQEYRESTENMEWKYPASRPFCEQKSFIEKTPLYEVFRMMPKCSLLHIHNAAALSTEGVIELLEEWTAAVKRDPTMQEIFIVTREGSTKIIGSLLYNPPVNLMPFCESLETFFRKQGAKEALKNLISLSNVERVESIPYVWDEFNNIFIRTGELLENSMFYYLYHYKAFMEMIEDRIEYAELRCSFAEFTGHPELLRPLNLIGADVEFLDVLKTAADEAIADWNEAHSKEKESRQFKIRVILSARRDLDILDTSARGNKGDKILLKMDAATVIMSNLKYKDFVVGFDLVSEEDRGKNTYTLFSRGLYQKVGEGFAEAQNQVDGAELVRVMPQLNQLRSRLLDFYLHDGESIWADNDNMLDAVIMSRHRIGHGFNMCKSPVLIDSLFPQAAVGNMEPTEPFLEICPISNQMLGYFPDLRNHNAYELIKRGVQCVLGNDDPMLLGNPGLSYDFWEAYIGMGLDMNAIKGLVFNAYIVKTLVDAGYPIIPGTPSYVLNIPACITSFNKQYWEPFLNNAYDYLLTNHLL